MTVKTCPRCKEKSLKNGNVALIDSGPIKLRRDSIYENDY